MKPVVLNSTHFSLVHNLILDCKHFILGNKKEQNVVNIIWQGERSTINGNRVKFVTKSA